MSLQETLDKATKLHSEGNLAEAELHYIELTKHAPDHPQLIINLANAQRDQGKINESLELLKNFISKGINVNAHIHHEIALMYDLAKDLEQAHHSHMKAAELDPQNISYLHNFAISNAKLRNFVESIKTCEKIVKIDSGNLDALMLIAYNFNALKNYEEAIRYTKNIIKMYPQNIDAYGNLIKAYRSYYKREEAIEAYEELLKITTKDKIPEITTLMLPMYQQVCDWKKWEEIKDFVVENTQVELKANKTTSISPFDILAAVDNAELCLKVANSHSNSFAEKAKAINANFKKEADPNKKKLTIGYVSADFRDCAVGFTIQHLFNDHNKERFNVHAYSIGLKNGSECETNIRNGCEKFVECFGYSDLEIARIINEDKVDILIDFTGYTSGQRQLIFALKPALININFLAFVGTIGGNYTDYIITDKVVTPEDHQKYYSEKCVYVPGSLQVNNSLERISEENLKKEDYDTPADAFVFGAYHQSYKITKRIFDIWLDLLKEVPKSVLWLRSCGPMFAENLKSYATKNGVDNSRIVILYPEMDRPRYYKRMSLMDLWLDTDIYNGGSTLCDALWAGVPTLTLLGNHYASRMASGVVNGVGLYDDMVTHSEEEYFERALDLANNKQKLEKIRSKLQANRTNTYVFDSPKIARNLEKAYEAMFERYSSGLPPEKIDIL